MSLAQFDLFAGRRQAAAVDPAAIEYAAPAAHELRPYQVEILDGESAETYARWCPKRDRPAFPGVLAALKEERATLVVGATGTGKTAVIGELAARERGVVLLLQYGNDLIDQNREKIAAWTGEYVALEQGESRARSGQRLIMASVPTLTGKRLGNFAGRHKPALIIADEAHHAIAPSWRAVVDAFPDAKVVGLTATPRAKGMGKVFGSVAYEYGIDRGIADCWLTGINVVPLDVKIDLRGVQARAGELVQTDLDDAVARCARDIADGLLLAADGVRSVIFTPGVMTAHATAEHLNGRRPGCARAIDGKMDRDQCRHILAEYAAGVFPYLLNCRKLVEGWDDPQTIGVMLSACIQSGGLYTQMVGRGTRLWPGIDRLKTVEERRAAIAASPKPKMLLLDPHYLSDQHDLASPVDLVGGALDEETRTTAKKILREKGGAPESAVAEARDRIEEKRRAAAAAAMRIRKAHRLADTLPSRVELGQVRDIFDRIGVRREAMDDYVRPEDRPTFKQAALFKRWGLPVPATRREWTKTLMIDKQRQKRGLCRLPGVHWLGRYGINAWKLTSAQALRVRNAIADNGYRSLPLETIDRLLQGGDA